MNSMHSILVVIFSNLHPLPDSQIDGDVNFYNTIFKRYVSFEKTHFAALANFVGVQFNGFNYISDDVASFRGAVFAQLAHFYGASFNGGAIFKGAKFSKFGGYIDRARFCDYALFDDAQFEGDTYFKKTRFDGLTRFSNVQLKDIHILDLPDSGNTPLLKSLTSISRFILMKLSSKEIISHSEMQYFFPPSRRKTLADGQKTCWKKQVTMRKPTITSIGRWRQSENKRLGMSVI